ncbi:hypothetical protein I5677_05820 [Mobilitalea sibirica]|uniref:Esterase n=1 Tax=Mobilitalea sibirica TaxID=1462919 RepID=A0A8J7HD36_9FIRM|nr:alpha/beta hydrolase-fold protein [Mobilitalea sibirica]MBH1940414.1 hypothetical protein [Mobilitalea sibirica]
MNKKYFIIIGCLIMIFSFGACKKDDVETNKNDTNAVIEEQNAEEGTTGAEAETDVEETSGSKNEPDEATSIDIADEPIETSDTSAVREEEDADVVEGEHYIRTTFTSEAITQALDPCDGTKDLNIYLPPSYYQSDKRYPVVYYFHGFGDHMRFLSTYQSSLDMNMALPENKEFIVVEVDGSRKNKSQGSFWVNSPVSGMWEDYIIKEIVPYIDENYKTIPKSESRATVGYSMGGFASINLALRNPDIFSSVLSVTPGLLKEGSMDIAMDSWTGDSTFKQCYGQTFAPNEDNENLCDIPKMDGTEADNAIIEKWETGFSNLEEKIDAYLEKKIPLKAIHVIYGTFDYYKWIPEGCENFSEILTKKGVEHTLTQLSAGHTIPSNFIRTYFVPYFTENLEFEE